MTTLVLPKKTLQFRHPVSKKYFIFADCFPHISKKMPETLHLFFPFQIFCEPDENIPQKLLQLYLEKREGSPVRWQGTESLQQMGACLELQGQFEEMKVPVTVGIHFMHLGKIWGLVEKEIPFLLDETKRIAWKQFPAELVLAKQIYV